MEWNTTSTILEALKDFSDDRTWSLFTERFRPAIIGFARRIGLDEVEAEDAAQTTLLAFAESYRAGRYDRDRGSLTSWLFTIAWRRVMDVHRDKGKRRGTVLCGGGDQGPELADLADPDVQKDLWDESWEAALLEQCLRQVRREVTSQTYRAFELVTIEEKDTESAATELGVTKNAVFIAKYRVLRRLKQLREAFDDVG